MSSSLIFSANSTDFVTSFPSPIVLEKGDYELALVNLETYHSFPNVQTGFFDSFTYSVNGGVSWTTIVISEGAYELEEISKYLYKQLKTRKHWDEQNDSSYIFLKGNLNTLKCELSITRRQYKVDFGAARSIGKLFGFEARIFEFGDSEGIHIADVMPVSAILLHCDVIGNSYVDGSTQPTLYSFYPNVPPGFKIVESPHNLLYLPVTRRIIHSIRFWLTDQAHQPLNLRGERLTMRVHLRKT